MLNTILYHSTLFGIEIAIKKINAILKSTFSYSFQAGKCVPFSDGAATLATLIFFVSRTVSVTDIINELKFDRFTTACLTHFFQQVFLVDPFQCNVDGIFVFIQPLQYKRR